VDVDPIPVRGRWWRHVRAGGDVYFRPEDPPDNRWQRGSIVDALYFADLESTAWAEWYRHLAEAGIPPMAALPRDLWAWDLDITLADLSDADRLRRVGLPVPRPGRFQWPLFQEVGHELWRDGWSGLMAPSAARPANLVVCLFREETELPGAAPVPPPILHEVPPHVPQGLTT